MTSSSPPPHIDANSDQRGFTLVELAIVLVIIGLIVGGVLKGQELIHSARTKASIAQIDDLQAAVVTFRDKYGGLPGDLWDGQALLGDAVGVTWINPPCNGTLYHCDGNRQLRGWGWRREGLLFWQHLAAAGLVTGIELSPEPSADAGEGVPASPLGGAIGVSQPFNYHGELGHWFRIMRDTRVHSGGWTGSDGRALDRKIDDGSPIGGSVRVDVRPDCFDDDSGDAWDIDAPECMVVIAFP